VKATLKLVSEVRDLQIVDRDQHNCGVCDDVEFEGGPGGALAIKALLVGPGAMQPRLPIWLARVTAWCVGRKMARIPWEDVESTSGRIVLKTSADAYRLHALDRKLAHYLAWIPAL
jgi:hypothetical protein